MQSGIKRRDFKFALGKASSGPTSKRSRHVTGIETDSLNTMTIVATLAGEIHVRLSDCISLTHSRTALANCLSDMQFFDFHNARQLGSMSLPSGITSTQLQRDNNLLACVCDDLTVRLIDIETRRIVREFTGFRGPVIDMVSHHLYQQPNTASLAKLLAAL